MTAHEVALLADIPNRGGLLVSVGGLEIGLFRIGTAVRAWRNHCPHMAAPVCRGAVAGTMLASAVYEYTPGRDGEVLQCPWHGWEFDLKSGVGLYDPYHHERVATYEVKREGDDIVLFA